MQIPLTYVLDPAKTLDQVLYKRVAEGDAFAQMRNEIGLPGMSH